MLLFYNVANGMGATFTGNSGGMGRKAGDEDSGNKNQKKYHKEKCMYTLI